MRKTHALAALLFASAAAPARAGYDKTEWGMTVAQVQQLYPGGVAIRQADGRTDYRVVRSVAGLSTALVSFDIGAPPEGLRRVSIIFPEQGTEVDLRQALFEPPSPSQVEAIRQTLRAALTSKYGAPSSSHEKDDTWLTAAGDAIYLGVATAGAGLSPVIVYSPPKTRAKDTSGL
ncbi:MAG TPA: hypothetical protein VMT17_03585 [Anaeromyxobacteraceae bacterium]|nr:hypothetical protein [Anaeromyxobacteraceae bacterium]